jgi:hypothetical protein
VILGVPYIVPIYFIYGLAFFSMGLLVAVEGGRASDVRLRRALPPLAGFGFVHAAHEWTEMYMLMGHPTTSMEVSIMWGIQIATLAFSFISLAAFGSFLLADTEVARRLILLIPIGLQAIWVFGLYHFRGQYTGQVLWDVDTDQTFAPDCHWAGPTTSLPSLRTHPLWTGCTVGSHHVRLVWSVWTIFRKSYPPFSFEYHQPANVR